MTILRGLGRGYIAFVWRVSILRDVFVLDVVIFFSGWVRSVLFEFFTGVSRFKIFIYELFFRFFGLDTEDINSIKDIFIVGGIDRFGNNRSFEYCNFGKCRIGSF